LQLQVALSSLPHSHWNMQCNHAQATAQYLHYQLTNQRRILSSRTLNMASSRDNYRTSHRWFWVISLNVQLLIALHSLRRKSYQIADLVLALLNNFLHSWNTAIWIFPLRTVHCWLAKHGSKRRTLNKSMCWGHHSWGQRNRSQNRGIEEQFELYQLPYHKLQGFYSFSCCCWCLMEVLSSQR